MGGVGRTRIDGAESCVGDCNDCCSGSIGGEGVGEGFALGQVGKDWYGEDGIGGEDGDWARSVDVGGVWVRQGLDADWNEKASCVCRHGDVCTEGRGAGEYRKDSQVNQKPRDQNDEMGASHPVSTAKLLHRCTFCGTAILPYLIF